MANNIPQLLKEAIEASVSDRPSALNKLVQALVNENADPFTVSGYAEQAKEAGLCTKTEFINAVKQLLQPKADSSIPKKTFIDHVAALNMLGYAFKVNDCNDDVEVNGELMTDLLESKIASQVRDKGFTNKTAFIDSYRRLAQQNRYHPVKDYWNSLSYDGGQYISELASHFQDKHGIFHSWLRKWLIGAVAKVMILEQNPMLVLDGRQDLGKSFFARWLVPEQLGRYFIEEAISTEDKDTKVRLTHVWIWEVAELQSTTRRADREALKHLISQKWVDVRRSYGKYDIHKPALSSFIGTVNNDSGLLNDPSGSRRYIIAHLTDIDWDYSTKVSVDNVWAEAYAAFLSGDRWKLSDEETQQREIINEEYAVPDPVEELIKKHFILDPKDKNRWMSSWDILELLQQQGLTGNQTGNLMKISSVMTKYGMEKGRQWSAKDKKQPAGYFGIEPVASVNTSKSGNSQTPFWDN